jgi:hypothetical protein
VVVAILLHLALVGGFWLIDRMRIRDIGEWSGPILVKIGVPSAPELPSPDPGPVPEVSETPVVEQPHLPPVPATDPVTPPSTGTSSTGSSQAAQTPQTVPDGKASNTSTAQPSAASSQVAKPAPPPAPSRVKGNEDGNSYDMNFNGSEDEVGRVAAYGYITSYMPLPETLDAFLVLGAKEYQKKSPEFIRGEIERYWELSGSQYVINSTYKNGVPIELRPYLWSLLTNSLGYDIAEADWHVPGMRPVVLEFTVGLSQGEGGKRGAELTNIVIKSRTNNPKVDEAVVYGLSKWVYYNKSDHPVKGRITYSFDR